MWQWLKQSLSSGRGKDTAAAKDTGFYVYRTRTHHRLITADGLFQLEPTLYERLIERIAASKPVGSNSSSVLDR